MYSLCGLLTGEGVLLLMNEFAWSKAFLISAEGADYGEVGTAIRNVSVFNF